MLTLGILATGLTIVIGGILGFRLHAFVALILAGMMVSLLSPSSLVTRSAMMESAVRQVVIDAEHRLVLSAKPLKKPTDFQLAVDPGDRRPLQAVGRLKQVRLLSDWPHEVPFQRPDADAKAADDGPACYDFELTDGVDPARVPNSLKLISSKDFASAVALGRQSFMTRLTSALGSYCGSLAILIVAASIIGRCLLDSGAADRIVTSTLNVVGEKNAPAAFVVSGFTLSIPVFFDTVFYLMIPLGKALRLRTGGNYLLYVLSIVAGGTMAHSLVPPTPGPLFIAEAFGVSLAAMIVGGCIVGLFSASVGMLYAVWVNQRYELKLPEEQEADGQTPAVLPAVTAEQNASAALAAAKPGLLVSLVPIVLPVLLITLGALVHEVEPEAAGEQTTFQWAGLSISETVAETLNVLGEKNLALLIAAIFAVLLFVKTKRPSKTALARSLQEAVSSAGTIILVTAAGGAFGRMMRQASVAELLEGLPESSPVMLVVAAFLVTTAVRSAQGSATVAMMTSAGIFGGLVVSGAAGVDPLYVALAVGCGSKPIAWMNDSGFWVITRMSGMTEREGLRYITPMTALAGLAGLGAVILGVVFFP